MWAPGAVGRAAWAAASQATLSMLRCCRNWMSLLKANSVDSSAIKRAAVASSTVSILCRSSGTSGSTTSSRKSFLRSVLRKPAAVATWLGEGEGEG